MPAVALTGILPMAVISFLVLVLLLATLVILAIVAVGIVAGVSTGTPLRLLVRSTTASRPRTHDRRRDAANVPHRHLEVA